MENNPQILTQYEVTLDAQGREQMRMVRQGVYTPQRALHYGVLEKTHVHEAIDAGNYTAHLETYLHPQRAVIPFSNKYRIILM
jgi:hypothetical protein